MSSEQHVTAPFPCAFDRDLENARVLIEESPWKDNPQKYRKVAEAIVRRVLSFDPSNESAKRLLRKTLEVPVPVPQPETPVLKANLNVVEIPATAPKLEVSVAPPKPEVFVAPPKLEVSVAPPKVEVPAPPPKLEVPVAPPKPEVFVAPPKLEVPVAPPKPEVFVAPPKLEVPVAPRKPEVFVAPPKLEVTVALPKLEPVPKPDPAPAREVPSKVVQLSIVEPPRRPDPQPEFTFTVEAPRLLGEPRPSRPPWRVIAFAAAGLIAGVTLLIAHRSTFTPAYPPKTPSAVPKVVQASSKPTTPEPAVSPDPAPGRAPAAAVEKPAAPPPPPPPQPAPKLEPVAAPPTVVVKSTPAPVAPVAPPETGTLAVSSPTTVDIYVNDQLVGSAPTTIVLPAGNQTIEYRHQDLRKVVTQTIKANDTTTAMVTFDVTVQINAKPWAQVFIDGSKRQPLGQTPLSDVRVPIGSNLIFENPNFPGKTYRVTGKETQIRVNFP